MTVAQLRARLALLPPDMPVSHVYDVVVRDGWDPGPALDWFGPDRHGEDSGHRLYIRDVPYVQLVERDLVTAVLQDVPITVDTAVESRREALLAHLEHLRYSYRLSV